MKQAISYIRWSSGKQTLGKSLERQTTSPEVTSFYKEHHLTPIKTMVHCGSSFRGKNFDADTALGKFLEQIRNGQIPSNTVLVLESIDRFGRDVITNMIPRFIDIIKAGVSIGVVDMNLIIDLAMMNENNAIWQLVSNEMQRSRRESARKSGFTKNNILSKVNAAKTGEHVYFGGQSPSWIKGVKNNQFIIDSGIAETIKRIFKEYLSGMSVVGIAKKFNADKVSTIYGKKGWFNTSIRSILTNKSVIGYCKVNDFVSDDYYPKIVTEPDFYKAQSKVAFNKSNRGGSPTGSVPNIFKGITKCKTCGGGVQVQSFTYKEKKYSYAMCDTSVLGQCKDKTRWKMDEFEETIFAFVLEQTPDELLVKPKAKPYSHLARLQGELDKVNHNINQTVELLGTVDMPQIQSKLIAFKNQKESLIKQMREEESKNTLIQSSPETVKKLKDLMKGIDLKAQNAATDSIHHRLKDVTVRAQLRNIMPDIFTKIEMDFSNWNADCQFTNGKQQAFDINSSVPFKTKIIKKGNHHVQVLVK